MQPHQPGSENGPPRRNQQPAHAADAAGATPGDGDRSSSLLLSPHGRDPTSPAGDALGGLQHQQQLVGSRHRQQSAGQVASLSGDKSAQDLSLLDAESVKSSPGSKQSIEGATTPKKGNQRWMKLRTTVQLSSAINSQGRSGKSPLKRQDSFIKKFSTRNIGEARDGSDGGGCDAQESQLFGNQFDPSGKPMTRTKKSDVAELTVINPDCQFYFRWLFVVTACSLYNMWTPIVRQAFPELQNDFHFYWLVCDVVCDAIFFVDILVQFRTGYLEQGLIVYDSEKLARHYVGSRSFWFDVACLTPLDLIQLQIGACPILRFPRFLKVYRVYAYYYIVESRTWYPNLWRVVNLIHVLLLLAHWFGCFYYLLSEYEEFAGDWVYPRPIGAFSTLTRKYLASMYWSTLTLTTIGDLPTPETNRQYLFTIVSYMIGVFIFATIVGQVGNVITNRNANRLEFERLLDSAKLYMRHHKVPREMQRRVQRWYDYSWSRGRLQGGGDINTALGILPDKLKTELALHVNLNTLKKVTIFQECQPEFLHDLVLKMKAYIFTPGDLICRKGEVAREMFIIADGILEVISETGKVLTTMKAGDFFGEIGILNLDGFNKRTADVRSVGYSELFSLSREDVLSAMKDYPDAREILQTLGRRRLMEAKKQASLHQTKPPSSQGGSGLGGGPPNAPDQQIALSNSTKFVMQPNSAKRIPSGASVGVLKGDRSDSDSQAVYSTAAAAAAAGYSRQNLVQRLRSDVREWKQQLMQRSPRTSRKDGVALAKSLSTRAAGSEDFPDPPEGPFAPAAAAAAGGAGGSLALAGRSGLGGPSGVGAGVAAIGGQAGFRIGSSSDESDPLLLSGSGQPLSRKHRHNGRQRPVSSKKASRRHRHLMTSMSSTESISRVDAFDVLSAKTTTEPSLVVKTKHREKNLAAHSAHGPGDTDEDEDDDDDSSPVYKSPPTSLPLQQLPPSTAALPPPPPDLIGGDPGGGQTVACAVGPPSAVSGPAVARRRRRGLRDGGGTDELPPKADDGPAGVEDDDQQTLCVFQDGDGGVSIEMQRLNAVAGSKKGTADAAGTSSSSQPERVKSTVSGRPRPPNSLALANVSVGRTGAGTLAGHPSGKRIPDVRGAAGDRVSDRSSDGFRSPCSRATDEVKISLNTPTEDSCSPEELEHFIPSQDPAAYRAELDILGTVYQVPPLLSPSRNASQKLKTSPRQLHRASIGSFEPAVFAKARTAKHAKYAKESSKTQDETHFSSPSKRGVRETKSLPQKSRSQDSQYEGSSSDKQVKPATVVGGPQQQQQQQVRVRRQTTAQEGYRPLAAKVVVPSASSGNSDAALAVDDVQPSAAAEVVVGGKEEAGNGGGGGKDPSGGSDFRIKGFPGSTAPAAAAGIRRSASEVKGKEETNPENETASSSKTSVGENKTQGDLESALTVAEIGKNESEGKKSAKPAKEKEACLTLKSILKTLSKSDLFLPDPSPRDLKKVKRCYTVDGSDSPGEKSKKIVTFERRSFSGVSGSLLDAAATSSESSSSSGDESSRFSKFNRWMSCLEGRGMEEKDKTLLACVLLGIKELLHDKMHKLGKQYACQILLLQTELRDREDTIKSLQKKLQTFQGRGGVEDTDTDESTTATSSDEDYKLLARYRPRPLGKSARLASTSRKQDGATSLDQAKLPKPKTSISHQATSPLIKTAFTNEELMELEFASALQRQPHHRATDVAIRIDDSPTPRHSEDETLLLDSQLRRRSDPTQATSRGATSPVRLGTQHLQRGGPRSGARSPNDWEVMMIAEQMTERDIREMKTADEVHLRQAAGRLLCMQAKQTGRMFSQEEEDEVAAGLREFSASELDLLEKMLREEERDRKTSTALRRTRSEKYSKPRKKRSMSLAPGDYLKSPVVQSPELPPFGSHGVYDVWAAPPAQPCLPPDTNPQVSITDSTLQAGSLLPTDEVTTKEEITLSPSTLIVAKTSTASTSSATAAAVVEINKAAVASVPAAQQVPSLAATKK